ncbi:protein white isoform X2 [Cimex lectularius]|uniref:Protein white n=1 Tax=Cimex lectularius TaxID=79782 RepID=A0A8I6ST79_CIMLE|nr:protein white isoform X2 [Cimex lectularius]
MSFSTTEVDDPTLTQQSSALSLDDHIIYTWLGVTVTCNVSNSHKLSCKLKGKPVVKKTLLRDVYGEARPGELLAIMGSSGAGKTTLLNCLTFRSDRKLDVSGFMMINGLPVTSRSLTSICGYVQQVDLFIGTLTVKESLIFHAMLRMEKGMPFEKRVARTEEVMRELNLKKCENTVVGIPGKLKGISGGEMKRLAFAAEMLTDPPILFCDEPTSGLDSFMAQNVVSVMKEMARKGKTVISTIHQPSSQVYGMFDKVLFMAEGKVAYLGSQALAGTFFKNFGAMCPSHHNPADYYVNLLAVAPGKEEQCRRKISTICEAFSNSQVAMELRDIGKRDKMYNEAYQVMKKISKYRAKWYSQFVAVFWRSWISVLKDPTALKAKLIQTIQNMDQDGVMNINGAIFVSLANMTFQNMFAVIHVFCGELPIFMREHTNGMYRTDVYFIAKVLAELPMFLTLSTMYTIIVYYMIGFNSQLERMLGAVVVMVLVGNISTALGYFISCACASISVALSLAPPIVIPFLLFGGFFLNTGSIPNYLSWFQYLSWFKYGNEAMMINQWKGVKNIACTKVGTTCPKNGMVILKTLNFDEKNYYFDLLMLVVLMIALQLGAFFMLFLRSIFKLV